MKNTALYKTISNINWYVYSSSFYLKLLLKLLTIDLLRTQTNEKPELLAIKIFIPSFQKLIKKIKLQYPNQIKKLNYSI